MKMDDETFDDVWDLREGGNVMLLRRIVELCSIVVYTILAVVAYGQREVDVVVDVNFFGWPECEHGSESSLTPTSVKFFKSSIGIRTHKASDETFILDWFKKISTKTIRTISTPTQRKTKEIT